MALLPRQCRHLKAAPRHAGVPRTVLTAHQPHQIQLRHRGAQQHPRQHIWQGVSTTLGSTRTAVLPPETRTLSSMGTAALAHIVDSRRWARRHARSSRSGWTTPIRLWTLCQRSPHSCRLRLRRAGAPPATPAPQRALTSQPRVLAAAPKLPAHLQVCQLQAMHCHSRLCRLTTASRAVLELCLLALAALNASGQAWRLRVGVHSSQASYRARLCRQRHAAGHLQPHQALLPPAT